MRSWASTFYAQFDAWCRGCNDDIFEGDLVGFIHGSKGLHCWDCIIEAEIEWEEGFNHDDSSAGL